MKPQLKIFFTDFWSNFDFKDNIFVKLLSEDFEVILDEINPHILFYSVFGVDYKKHNCIRVSFIGENLRPDFNKADFSFNFDYNDNPRNYRLPLYALWNDVYLLTKPRNPEELVNNKTKFCNFIYSNPGPKKRIEFFEKLSKYKKVDSAGRVRNNLGYKVKDKLEFIKDYKFTLALESYNYPGYTTEKIFEPFLMGSLPIYWGNKFVDRDFNTKSFLNYNEFGSDEELIEKIIEIDNNDELLFKYFSEPCFKDNKVNEFASNENIKKQLLIIANYNSNLVASNSLYFKLSPSIVKLIHSFAKIDYKTKVMIDKLKKFELSKLKFLDYK